jgi:hypothetical protein
MTEIQLTELQCEPIKRTSPPKYRWVLLLFPVCAVLFVLTAVLGQAW